MRPLWKDILIAAWLGIIVPGIALNGVVLQERQQERQELSLETVQGTGEWISLEQPDGTVRKLQLESYLTEVLLGEMPAEFHPEALKAQAVAARTFTWKANSTGGKHKGSALCTNSACCQAYISKDDYFSCGGTGEQYEKVQNAVQATSGFVLVYEGELIEATYFSSSGGSTESALAVWGADYPYLQAVSSPEETNIHSCFFTRSELGNRLGITLSENPEESFGPVTYTEGGGVETMELCGTTFTGLELRSLLGLRSTQFEINPEGDGVIITTKGYGHRVGMSQYGANAMAESGSTWQEILQHYYPDTLLVPIRERQ